MPAMRRIFEVAVAVIVGAVPSIVFAQVKAAKRVPTAAPAPSGEKVYSAMCAACHQPTGSGSPEKYPLLAGSEIAAGNEERLVRIVLHGVNSR